MEKDIVFQQELVILNCDSDLEEIEHIEISVRGSTDSEDSEIEILQDGKKRKASRSERISSLQTRNGSSFRSKKWTAAEDQIIKEIVQTRGLKQLKLLTRQNLDGLGLHNREPEKCINRWEQYLDPAIDKSPFSETEANVIFMKFKLVGSQWKAIAKMLRNRTGRQVKSFYEKTLK